MKQIPIYLIVFLLLISCQKQQMKSNFAVPKELNEARIVPTDSIDAKTILLEKPKSLISASEIIGEFHYIPLETAPEALIGDFCNVIIYKDYIYVLDDITSPETVFIYNMEGKFLKKLGTKGGGPEEFYLLHGMRIDKKTDQLILYDNRKRKMMYYTLNGAFIKKVDVLYRFSGQYEVLPSGMMVSVTRKNHGNFQLDDYERFRLIYTDSLGQIKKFGYHFDDNINLSVSWSKIFWNENELLYFPQFSNSIFSISDTLIRQKYVIDFHQFTPFDFSRILEFKSNENFGKQWFQATTLSSFIAENRTHLYFSIDDKKKHYSYFHNRSNDQLTGFEKMLFDTDFIVKFPIEYNYKDYFMGVVSTATLLDFKKYRDQEGNPLSKQINEMIGKMKEDDNGVLVLFKLKDNI